MVGTLLSTGSNAGANLRELMDRMGHASARAALLYLHGSDERQQAIAAALSKRAAAELEGHGSGHRARNGTATGNGIVTTHNDRANMALTWVYDRRARQDSNLRPAA